MIKKNNNLNRTSALIGYLFLITQLINNLFFHSTHISTIRFPPEDNYGNQLIPIQIIFCIIIPTLYRYFNLRVEKVLWITWLFCLINSVTLFSMDHQYYRIEFLTLLLLAFISSVIQDIIINRPKFK